MEIIQVTTPQDFELLYEFRRNVYVEELKWFDSDSSIIDKYDALAYNYAAFDNTGNIAGAIRVVPDSIMGLPVENFCNIESIKKKKKLVEFNKLAISKAQRSTRLILGLMSVAYQRAELLDASHVIIDTFLSEEELYLGLGFVRVGLPYIDPDCLVNDKVVAMLNSMDNATTKLLKKRPFISNKLTIHSSRHWHNKRIDQKELYTKNYPFISQSVQKKLSQIKVGLVGVGLSSQLAQTLVRMGVKHLSLWDHDKVSLSNLNRQAFGYNDIGENKAIITGQNLKKINPEIELQIYPRQFENEDLNLALKDIDIVVNSIDFNNPLVYTLNTYMQENGGWCIQPFNLGFGGSCMIFGPGSAKLEELTEGRQTNSTFFITNLLKNSSGFKPGRQLEELAVKLLKNGETTGSFPQNIIATGITISLIGWAIEQILSGNAKDIMAPEMLHFEPRLSHLKPATDLHSIIQKVEENQH